MDSTGALSLALQAEQLRLHRVILPSSVSASALAGVVIGSLLWGSADRTMLLVWLACLVGVLGLRLGVGMAHARAPQADLHRAVWRRRYRLCFLLHGLAWALAGMVLLPSGGGAQLDLLTFVLVAIAAGSLIASAFDLLAAAVFAVPALTPLAIHHFGHFMQGSVGLGFVMFVFLLSTIMSALRVNRMVREQVRQGLRQVQQAHALRDSEAEQRALLEAFPGHIAAFDHGFRFTYVNAALASALEQTPQEILGRSIRVVFGEERFHRNEWALEEAKAGRRAVCEGGFAATATRACVDLEVTYVPGPVAGDGRRRYYAFGQDITQRKRAEEQLRIAAVSFEAQEGIMVTDANNVVLRVNKAFTESSGYTSEELVGQSPKILRSGRHGPEFYAAMWESIHRTGSWQGEVWDRRKNGEVVPKWLNVSAVRNEEGVVTNYVGTDFDITERKQAEQRIEELAYFDRVTHLPNRSLLMDRLKQAMTASQRSGSFGAALWINLDHFKRVNDTMGQESGDLLLQIVAQRLTLCVRAGDTVARLGGDEFVVLLPGLSGVSGEAASQVEDIGNKILALLNQAYQLDGADHHITASMGASLFGGNSDTADELLKQANLAMQRAKDTGRNTLRFFDPAMQAVILQQAELEAGLRLAVQNNELVLHYQAQMTGDREMAGAEALVRWLHPVRGMVSPGEFIPVAEESGLILPLGQWVLETACSQLAQWAGKPALADLVLAVNVSALQLQQHDFVDTVIDVLQHTGANPRRLKLELTESLLVANIDETIAKMSALKAIGVSFSLDDFGTGYSSLAYLSRLPLDQLKIDRSFVMHIESRDDAVAICAATISLAHSLKLKVVAEGVETEAQRYFLSTVHRCDLIQGYLFSRPLPLAEFESLAQR
ncbi:MAG: EAL domain-containing protein [Rhodoferax sp.]|nr:EAL domain-containing protein [Rhodoferax sp.]